MQIIISRKQLNQFVARLRESYFSTLSSSVEILKKVKVINDMTDHMNTIVQAVVTKKNK